MSEGGHRSVAERITRALIKGNLTPVSTLFANASPSDLAADVRFGALSDRLNSLGELHGVRYQGPGDSPDAQVFLATFAHGIIREELAFDGSRVIGFTLLPESAP